MSSETITLIGDSVLDNFYWLDNKKDDLTQQLRDMGYTVNNFAVDESKLEDIDNGVVPQDVYQKSRNYPYPVNKSGKVVPLDLITAKEKQTTVISVGGNDIRVNLYKFMFVNATIAFTSIFNEKYINDFEELLSQIKPFSPKIILVCVYIPYIGVGSNYAILTGIKDPVYDQLINVYKFLGTKFNIPVLDLSRTFNCYNRKHYGKTEIEPSNISSKCIADCIAYIHSNYQGYNVYYAPDCDVTHIRKDIL